MSGAGKRLRLRVERPLRTCRVAGVDAQAARLRERVERGAKDEVVDRSRGGTGGAPRKEAGVAPPSAPEEDPAFVEALRSAQARGRLEAENAWRLRVGSVLERFEKAVAAFETNAVEDATAALRAIEEEAAAFAVAVAEKAIANELKQGRHRIEKLVEQAFSAARERLGTHAVRLRLHPEDVVALTEAAGAELKQALGRVEVLAAPEIERGEVEIETRSGLMFTGARQTLREIRERLLAADDDGEETA